MNISGKKLRILRENKGWSQVALSQRVGLNPMTVGKIEGRGAATPANVAKIAKALGVTVEDLRR